MSDTTAFLGGAAFASLAAFMLLKGGVGLAGYGAPENQALPAPPIVPSVPVAPSTSAVSLAGSLTPEQQVELAQIKSQLEQQRTETEKLKTQVQTQQAMLDTMAAKEKLDAQQALQTKSIQEAISSSTANANNHSMAGMMWALGGAALALGAGGMLTMVFALFSRPQARPARTVEVIHAMEPPTPLPRRQAHLAPARRVVRRVDFEDAD